MDQSQFGICHAVPETRKLANNRSLTESKGMSYKKKIKNVKWGKV